jgi:hypothetical protein
MKGIFNLPKKEQVNHLRLFFEALFIGRTNS